VLRTLPTLLSTAGALARLCGCSENPRAGHRVNGLNSTAYIEGFGDVGLCRA
jgi:hypothetical protein